MHSWGGKYLLFFGASDFCFFPLYVRYLFALVFL